MPAPSAPDFAALGRIFLTEPDWPVDNTKPLPVNLTSEEIRTMVRDILG